MGVDAALTMGTWGVWVSGLGGVLEPRKELDSAWLTKGHGMEKNCTDAKSFIKYIMFKPIVRSLY